MGVTTAPPAGEDEQVDETIIDQIEDQDDEEYEVEANGRKQKMIPMARFEALNEKQKLTAAERDEVKEQFGTMAAFRDWIEEMNASGIHSSDDLRNFLDKQSTESAATARKTEETAAATMYHRLKDEGQPDSVAQQAYNNAMQSAKNKYETVILDRRSAAAARSNSGNASVSARVQAMAAKYEHADKDTLTQLAKVPGIDLEAEAKRLHSKEVARQATYAKSKTTQREAKGSPTASGANARPAGRFGPSPNPLTDPKGAAEWNKNVKAAYPPG